MDELRVNRTEFAGVRPVGDGSAEHERRRRRDQASDEERDEHRTPDELAFLLRRVRVAGPKLTDTRVELVQAGGDTRVRILDAASGTLIHELSAAELATLAREAQVTTGLLREWRT